VAFSTWSTPETRYPAGNPDYLQNCFSSFLGTYGLYIVVGVAVISLVIILWRFFRRDPADGVGIKLN
jgi:hypothetical protein